MNKGGLPSIIIHPQHLYYTRNINSTQRNNHCSSITLYLSSACVLGWGRQVAYHLHDPSPSLERSTYGAAGEKTIERTSSKENVYASGTAAYSIRLARRRGIRLCDCPGQLVGQDLNLICCYPVSCDWFQQTRSPSCVFPPRRPPLPVTFPAC